MLKDRLVQIILSEDVPKIVVIGDMMLDKYIWGEAKRISQEAPIPVLLVSSEEIRPGGAGNVINNLYTLGTEVFTCGIIGDDTHGNALLNTFKKMGIDTSGILIDSSRPTIQKIRLMGHLQTAGKGVQQLLRVDYEKTHPISAEIESRLARYLNKVIPLSDVVLISDMNKGLLSDSFLKYILSICKIHNKIAIVDPKLDNNYKCYRGFTAITPNRYETELATGIKITDNDSLNKAATRLISSLSLEYCVITIDREGIFLRQKGVPGKILPTSPRSVLDVSGAGDMVISMLGWVIGHGHSFEDAAQLANIAAGLEVGKIGAAPVSKEEILGELMGRKYPLSKKIKDIETLMKLLQEHRKNNEKIVFTNGCFDILHVGHVEYLKFARRQGDLLVVGLNTDQSVRGQKGPVRPFLPETERAKMLAALEDVTYVVYFDEPTPLNLIKTIRPDILVKGEDWKDAGVVGKEFVESYGGSVALAPMVKGISTSTIVSRILQRHGVTEYQKTT